MIAREGERGREKRRKGNERKKRERGNYRINRSIEKSKAKTIQKE